MNEYILVEFDETREVIINDTDSGCNTGEVIEVGAGTQTISLKGAQNFSPLKQDINLSGSSPIKPYKIYFKKI